MIKKAFLVFLTTLLVVTLQLQTYPEENSSTVLDKMTEIESLLGIEKKDLAILTRLENTEKTLFGKINEGTIIERINIVADKMG
jgi:hypothetical protein